MSVTKVEEPASSSVPWPTDMGSRYQTGSRVLERGHLQKVALEAVEEKVRGLKTGKLLLPSTPFFVWSFT